MQFIIIAPDKSFTLNFFIMKYSKKVLYRHIRMLQNFSVVYRSKINHPTGTVLYEVTKLSKDSFGNVSKYIDFLVSGESLPVILPLEFDVFIKALTKSDIVNLVHQCKEFGIL